MSTERPNDPFGLSQSDFAVPGSDDNIIDTPQAQSMVRGINSENVSHAIELHNEYKNYRKLYEIFVDLYQISKEKNIFNGMLNKLKKSQQEKESATEWENYHCSRCECDDDYDYSEIGGTDHEEIVKKEFENADKDRYEQQQITELNIALKDLDKKEKELLKNLIVEVDNYGWEKNRFKWGLKN